MSNKWSCSQLTRLQATDVAAILFALLLASCWAPSTACASDAPSWLHSLAMQTLPAYPPETKAVVLLDERLITVKENGETRTTHRRAYKILRAAGHDEGLVAIPFDNETKVSNLRGWCIPAHGKDYEVKDKDAIEVNLGEGILYQDHKVKVLKIPAADPGNVIGYEYEQKQRPYILQETWWFQGLNPVRQARFTLDLPSGWEFKEDWVNHERLKASAGKANHWEWSLHDISAVKLEPEMPPSAALEGRLIVGFFPRDPAVRQKTIESWNDFGRWYSKLTDGRRNPSVELKQRVQELTRNISSPLAKIRALAAFVQRDIRYVAIEIGIGGYQPHPAADIFANRYGDCKDKATVLSAMLNEIGVASYYVVAQTLRGILRSDSPPAFGSFNHAILAIRLPENLPSDELHAVYVHPRLGRLLFFDPTDTITPLGYLPSSLQANYGMLVSDAGGELVQMPLAPPSSNQLVRSGKFTLHPNGALSGDIEEMRIGVHAITRRSQLLEAQSKERAKVLESFLASSLGGFALTKASIGNLEQYDRALTLNYSFVAANYAQAAGDLILVRPRVLGWKGSSLLEIKDRTYPVEFPEASEQRDTFEITLPPGLVVDELPAPVESDYSFASYRSKTEFSSGVLRYTRTYQVKEVMVPTARLAELKRFYRQIAQDETGSVILKQSKH